MVNRPSTWRVRLTARGGTKTDISTSATAPEKLRPLHGGSRSLVWESLARFNERPTKGTDKTQEAFRDNWKEQRSMTATGKSCLAALRAFLLLNLSFKGKQCSIRLDHKVLNRKIGGNWNHCHGVLRCLNGSLTWSTTRKIGPGSRRTIRAGNNGKWQL